MMVPYVADASARSRHRRKLDLCRRQERTPRNSSNTMGCSGSRCRVTPPRSTTSCEHRVAGWTSFTRRSGIRGGRKNSLRNRSAHSVMREWTRAEPDHRYMTKREIGAMQAAITRKHRAQYKADEARWERDQDRYDPDREEARLPLQPRHRRRHRHTRRHRHQQRPLPGARLRKLRDRLHAIDRTATGPEAPYRRGGE